MYGMMTTNYLRNLLTAVVCLFASVSVNAQFTSKVEQVPNDTYAPVPATFQIAEVAEALGTDAETLFAALDSWMAEGSTDPNMFFYAAPSAPDTWADGYTTGGEKGFWLDPDGEICGWGDTAGYYCNPVYDKEAGTFSINIGMMPGALKYGVYNKSLTFALKYGDKTATFTIDLTVTGSEEVNLPEIATLKEAELNIVGTKEVTIEQYPRSGYDADAVEVVLDDIVAAFGLESGAVIQSALEQMIYTTECGTIENNFQKLDSVTNKFTAGAPGFWYSDIRDAEGNTTGEVSAAAYGGADKFYMEAFAFNAETNALTCNLGQYPGSLDEDGGKSWWASVYLIYGDKAYRIKYTLKVLEREQGNGLADYTKVGEGEVTVEQEPNGTYNTTTVRPDLEAIAALLGCEVADIKMQALDAFESWGANTANNGGFWFSGDGTVINWGENAKMFIEPAASGDLSRLNVGMYPNALEIGQTTSAFIYFVYEQNYYAYTVTIKAVEPKEVGGDFENVRTINFTIQVVPSADTYPIDETFSMDPKVIENFIGTADPVLYGPASDAKKEETGSPYTDAYSCDPRPGFWMTGDGRVGVWGDADARVGICYSSDGNFQFFQYPGRNSIGDVFKTELYLVNPDNGKMMTFNISVAFVETVVKAEEVGSAEIWIPVTNDDKKMEIDLSQAAEALGVTVDALLDDNANYLRGMTIDGFYSEGQNILDGLCFNLLGYYDVEGAIQVTFEKDGDKVLLTSYCSEAVAEDFSIKAQFCFQVEGKQYVYHATLCSEAIYSGINTIATESRNNGQIFDLSGRKVQKPTRGLYILNGKKIAIK